MNKYIKYIIPAFLVFSLAICVISIIYFKSADVAAVYTRNNLSWSNADVFEDGSIKLDLTNGKTTVRLKNGVKGKIGYNLYLYAEKEISNEIKLPKKDMTEINPNEYPESLKNCDIKCAYRGYLKGNKKKDFEINSIGDTSLKLLMVIEDNNSYPKEEKNIPTVANVKFSAEVLLDGQYPRGKNYSFSLQNEEGKVIETVHNDDGYISFSNIALKEKGTYIYYLSQNEGKDEETTYDKSIYKINVVVEGKNVAKVSYEKDGTPKETLPRFSNYKQIIDAENIVEYPTNEKKSNEQPNYLLISVLTIGVLLILFYIVMGKKKG
ncbi:MAG: hypothetical protein IJ423_00480 [Clostridia bacterium]|nr:hypothetical protein [Clostridia bacterium]